MRAPVWLCAAVLALSYVRAAHAEQVLQIPLEGLLDGRPVTTLENGALASWTVGIDKDDGFITSAAAAFLKQTGTALPDDGSFAMNADHPQMVLHFSNGAGATSPQAHAVSAVGSFEFATPHAVYSQLFLAITSSYGDAPLSVTLKYTDASSSPVQFTLPDWGTGQPLPKTPAIFFNLISGLHKWTRDNASVDTPSHSLTGVKLSPAADKQLSSVQVTKTTATPYLVFWGATGVATGPVDSGGAAGAAGTAGASGSSGGAGMPAESGGTAGSAGTAGGPSAGLGGALGGSAGTAAAAGAAASAGQSGALAGSAGAAPSSASTDSASGCNVAPRGTQSRVPAAPWLCAPLGVALALVRRKRRFSSRR